MKNWIASISVIDLENGNQVQKTFELKESSVTIIQNNEQEHVVTFNLKNEDFFWKQLGYKSYQEYEDSLILWDIEKDKKYSFKDFKEIK